MNEVYISENFKSKIKASSAKVSKLKISIKKKEGMYYKKIIKSQNRLCI